MLVRICICGMRCLSVERGLNFVVDFVSGDEFAETYWVCDIFSVCLSVASWIIDRRCDEYWWNEKFQHEGILT